MIGNTISNGVLNNNVIDINKLSKGIYFICIKNQNNNYLGKYMKFRKTLAPRE